MNIYRSLASIALLALCGQASATLVQFDYTLERGANPAAFLGDVATGTITFDTANYVQVNGLVRRYLDVSMTFATTGAEGPVYFDAENLEIDVVDRLTGTDNLVLRDVLNADVVYTNVSSNISQVNSIQLYLTDTDGGAHDGFPYPVIAELSNYDVKELDVSVNKADTSLAFEEYELTSLILTPTPAVINVTPTGLSTAIHPHHDGRFLTLGALPDDVIAVEVFGSSTASGDPVDLDTADIAASTLRFGPAQGAVNTGMAPEFNLDIDSDGLDDARFFFLMSETGIGCADTEAVLAGDLATGSFSGVDEFSTDCDAQCHN